MIDSWFTLRVTYRFEVRTFMDDELERVCKEGIVS
jgi:hypothetical protein